jgi:hypothetical protein
MIKRPLDPRFREDVLAGRKRTTIRDKAWPLGVPIMLYSWSGNPYRSKQYEVAPVVVGEVRSIKITHREDGGMLYAYGEPAKKPLYETEGFASREEMDAWFRPLVAPGKTVEKQLMCFLLAVGLAYRGSDGATTCFLCDCEMEWEDCSACAGDGGFDGYEEDPNWYAPGEIAPCSQCRSKGGDWWCQTKDCKTITCARVVSLPNTESRQPGPR